MAVDSITSSSSTSSLTSSRKSIADNFDTFLTLLTTQLKNQNPLEPMDTNQFTQQMVQFTSVEQQLKTNEFLEALVGASTTEADASSSAALATQAINLIDKTVVIGSSATQLTNGEAKWDYTLSADAPNSTITIYNKYGEAVFSKEMSLLKGENTFAWDGEDASGLRLDDGQYSLSIDAKSENGTRVTALTQAKGKVTVVDLSGSTPMLVVNGSRVPLDSVMSVVSDTEASS